VIKRQNNKKKSTQWDALRTTNWFPWSLPKVTGDSRRASKGIHWCQTSANCFRQIYRYSLHCTKRL